MSLSGLFLIAAITSSEAIATLLNGPSAVGPSRYAEAKARVESDAAEGRTVQQFVIGVTTDDRDRAERMLSASREKMRALAEKKENPLAWYLLSMDGNDIGLLRRAADGGNVQAMNAFGTITTQEALKSKTISTNELQRILERSFRYFSKASEKGDPNGFINLGTCYLRGLGCTRDARMAVRCFAAAAKKGHPEGMDCISACYEHGEGVRRDLDASLYWKMRGRAARGDRPAEEWLRTKR